MSNRKRGDDETDNDADTKVKAEERNSCAAERLHIEGQEGDDHQQSDHVDEGSQHECEQFGGNLANFSSEDVEQSDRDYDEQHAHNRRLKRLGDVLLYQQQNFKCG